MNSTATIEDISRLLVAVETGELKIDDQFLHRARATLVEIDQKLSEQISQILHHPEFQALEASWRGLAYLVMNTEPDEMLRIRVLNITKRELRSALITEAGEFREQSPIYNRVCQEEFAVFGGRPFGALLGDYYFDHSTDNVELLTAIVRIAACAHAPFIAGASPSLLGLATWPELNENQPVGQVFRGERYTRWNSLRENPESRYLALILPRVLGRLCYGASHDRVQEFDYEEGCGGSDPKKFLWMNAAYALGSSVTRAFKDYGWSGAVFGYKGMSSIDNLPTARFFRESGETEAARSTEVWIPDRKENEFCGVGLIPLCFVKNSTAATFRAAYSVHQPKGQDGCAADQWNAALDGTLTSQLPWVFAGSRFIHYLKCIVRDKEGKLRDRADVELLLNKWLQNYSIVNPKDANEEMKAKRPLSSARVKLSEIPGKPGSFNGVFQFQPHFKMDNVPVSLRFEFTLEERQKYTEERGLTY